MTQEIPKVLKKALFFILLIGAINVSAQNFRTVWRTTTPNESITIPTAGSGYNYTVDWGDGNSDSGQTADATHIYSVAGDYTVTISGDFPRISFNNSGDYVKILSIEEWGSSIAWTNMSSAFSGCYLLVNNANDVPNLSNVTSIEKMFNNCTNIGTGTAKNWNSWNTSEVTNMRVLFSNTRFNRDISNWDVSKVTNMSSMFSGVSLFNQDIGSWDVSKVTNMTYMFSGAESFNQDIGSWNVSEVTNMSYMFNYGYSFNKDIGSWNVSKVENMGRMFQNASSFNKNIGSWDVTNVTNVYAMFKDASSFNKDIGGWTLTKVTNFGEMFSNADNFDQDISGWNIENVNFMTSMFSNVTLSTRNYDALLVSWNAQNLQPSLSFNAGDSKYCSQVAVDARANMIASDGWFISDDGASCTSTYFLTTWKTDNTGDSTDTSITIPTTGSGYNYDVDWDNDGVFDSTGVTGDITYDFGTPGTYTIAIQGSFPRIYFNNGGDKLKILSVEQWGDIAWTSMGDAFEGCSNLVNNATDTPNLSNATSMEKMFRRCTNIGLGTASNWNYWDTSNITDLGSMFSNANSFNKNIGDWEVSLVTDMGSMFSEATSFNIDISDWDVSAVTTMSSMFSGATLFNRDIGNWDVSAVTSMSSMFRSATLFNQDIGNWDVSSVTNMYYTFNTATSFNQDLSNWNVTAVTTMTDMFTNVTLSSENYDNLLIGWNAQSLQSGVVFSAGDSKYHSQEATDAKENMETSNTWTITDGGRTSVIEWTGTTNTDWNTDSNWDASIVPLAHNDVTIPNVANTPIISATTGVTTNNITVDTDALLVIENGGSLIVSGTLSGEVTYNVNVQDTNWYLISSPVVGEQYDSAGWITDNSIDTSGTGDNEGISTYDNTTDTDGDWMYYQSNSGAENFQQGKGYSLKRTVPGNYGFTGTYPDTDFSSTITIANEGTGNENRWNLVGNPYPSYILASDVLTVNTNNLTDTHEFVYVWDNSLNSGTGGYKTIGGSDYINPGQAFFVNADNSNSDNFIIPESLQYHQTDVLFKSSTPSIQLFITDGTSSKYTEVKYEENATTSLDKGLDAGTFTGASTAFSVYSHLVENSEGVDFMLQSLPKDNYENMVIPIGVNADAGKEIVFSAEVSNLPEDVQLFLEDKNTNSFTQLNEENSEYKVTLTEMSNGIGRFYIHTAAQKSLSTTPNIVLNDVSVYKTEASKLRIAGTSQGKSTITLFNLEGKQILSTSFILDSLHDVSLPKLSSGVYIVQLQTEVGVLNKKIILE